MCFFVNYHLRLVHKRKHHLLHLILWPLQVEGQGDGSSLGSLLERQAEPLLWVWLGAGPLLWAEPLEGERVKDEDEREGGEEGRVL